MIKIHPQKNSIFDKVTVNYLLLSVTVFTLAIIIGFYLGGIIYPPFSSSNALPKIQKVNSNLYDIFKQIFFNNYKVALYLVFLGYFSGGIITMLIIITNGLSTGYNLHYINIQNLGGLSGLFNRLFFHGFIELFALFLMGSIGLRGFNTMLHFVKNDGATLQGNIVTRQIVFHFFIGSILLFIAAIIESIIFNSIS